MCDEPVAFKQAQHLHISCGAADFRVFALGVNQYGGHAIAGEACNHARNSRRFATACRAQHGYVARQHRLAVRRHLHGHGLEADGQPQFNWRLLDEPQLAARLRLAEHEHGAVGQRAITGRHQRTLNFLAQDFDLHASVVARHKLRAVDCGRHDDGRVGAQPVRLGKGTLHHGAQILAAVAPRLSSAAEDAHQRLRRHTANRIGGQ